MISFTPPFPHPDTEMIAGSHLHELMSLSYARQDHRREAENRFPSAQKHVLVTSGASLDVTIRTFQLMLLQEEQMKVGQQLG